MVPMDEEEAVDQMELLGHDFYVFFNVNQSQLTVVYRRRSVYYGLIQPEVRVEGAFSWDWRPEGLGTDRTNAGPRRHRS